LRSAITTSASGGWPARLAKPPTETSTPFSPSDSPITALAVDMPKSSWKWP
jgi:hypothetical protein